VVANYTTEQLNNIILKIDIAFMKEANRVYNKYGLGINCTNFCDYYKLWLYKRIISGWHQLNNGDSTGIYNSITVTQFNNIVADALNYCD
jgi:hypothetical protein